MQPLQQELESLTVGQPTTFRNLTLFPLTRTRSVATRPYLLADQAMESGLARVTEIDGGTVHELRFANRADLPVLLLDGEELVARSRTAS